MAEVRIMATEAATWMACLKRILRTGRPIGSLSSFCMKPFLMTLPGTVGIKQQPLFFDLFF